MEITLMFRWSGSRVCNISRCYGRPVTLASVREPTPSEIELLFAAELMSAAPIPAIRGGGRSPSMGA